MTFFNFQIKILGLVGVDWYELHSLTKRPKSVRVQQPKAIYLANLVSSDKKKFCGLLIRSRWVWSCYPWAIRELQDGDQSD